MICATTGADVTTNQVAFDAKSSSDMEIGVLDGHVAWKIVDRQHWNVGTYQVEPNTTYWFKCAKEGNWVRCYVSTDGEKWTLDCELETNSLDNFTNVTFRIGTEETSGQYWRGTIDLGKSHINAHGNVYSLVEDVSCVVHFNSEGGSEV